MFNSKKLVKSALLLALSAIIVLPSTNAEAKSIRTTNGEMPTVYWSQLAAFPYINNISTLKGLLNQYVVPTTATEPGTYANYSVTAAENSNLMRGIEIYENIAAYQLHTNSPNYIKYLTKRIPITQIANDNQVTPLVLESKESGTATAVYMADITLNSSKMSKYNDLNETEMMRAVDTVPGVLAAFSVADAIYPQNIHNMILFQDSAAQTQYLNSPEYLAFANVVKFDNMVQSEKVLTNQTANIKLTGKGLQEHKEKVKATEVKEKKKSKKSKKVFAIG